MKRIALYSLLLLTALCVSAQADDLNYDPLTPAPPPVLDAGWSYDQIDFALTDSVDSPYPYNLAVPATFRITDQFAVGDTYYVYDDIPIANTLILTTVVGPPPSNPLGLVPVGDPNGNAGWVNPIYGHGEVLLSAGLHSLRVQGNGLGGLSAGLYVRIDSVPEPSTFLLTSGLVFGAFIARARRARG